MRRAVSAAHSVLVALAACAATACGSSGSSIDAAVVELRCDDPTVVDPVRTAAQVLADGSYVAPAAQSRAALIAAVDQAAAAITTGPADVAGSAIESGIGAAIDANVSDPTARADLHTLT